MARGSQEAVSADKCRWREEGGGEDVAARCLAFLDEIGIEVDWLDGADAQLLDGLAIVNGRLLIDPGTDVWPGDLLHEAGHIAVADPELRPTLGPLEADPTDEMMAIGWSWAAAKVCEMQPRHLFHDGGYRGDSARLVTAYRIGQNIGAPMLGYYGMCCDMATGLAEGKPSYPNMLRWIR
jgi:hypothetical protein